MLAYGHDKGNLRYYAGLLLKTYFIAILGVYYANAEAVENLHMVDWEVDRIKLLLDNGEVSLEALQEDVAAILSEISMVQSLRGLKRDKIITLAKKRKTLQKLQSEIKRKYMRGHQNRDLRLESDNGKYQKRWSVYYPLHVKRNHFIQHH